MECIGRIEMEEKDSFVGAVCRYWSLKREARRGAPLLKRLHLEVRSSYRLLLTMLTLSSTALDCVGFVETSNRSRKSKEARTHSSASKRPRETTTAHRSCRPTRAEETGTGTAVANGRRQIHLFERCRFKEHPRQNRSVRRLSRAGPPHADSAVTESTRMESSPCPSLDCKRRIITTS